MSRKMQKEITKKEKGLELGGFIVRHRVRNNRQEYVAVSRSRQWSVVFGQELPQYALIAQMVAEEMMHDYLHTWLCMIYQMATVMPDLSLMGDWYNALGAYTERTKVDLPDLSEEELEQMNLQAHNYDSFVRNGDSQFDAAMEEMERNRDAMITEIKEEIAKDYPEVSEDA